MTVPSLTLGIDLGGTKIDIGVVDSAGKILRRELIKTSKIGPETVVNDIHETVQKLIQKNEHFEAAGVGMAGQIDSKTGDVNFAPNLRWSNFPLGSELEKKLQIPVKVTNDVRAAAWGEWLYGAGRGSKDLICLFVGTGIGAGIVSDGNMLIGNNNAAGEVGHMTIDLNGPLCSCGNRGCFEAFAGGWAITRRAKEIISQDFLEGKNFLDLMGCEIDQVTGRHVIEAYQQKSPLAIKVVEEVKEALIAGVANLVNAFNPEKIILGGGIITGAPFFIDVIRKGVPERALKATSENLQVVHTELKGDASVIGAGAFAKRKE
jgi:glucokinase